MLQASSFQAVPVRFWHSFQMVFKPHKEPDMIHLELRKGVFSPLFRILEVTDAVGLKERRQSTVDNSDSNSELPAVVNDKRRHSYRMDEKIQMRTARSELSTQEQEAGSSLPTSRSPYPERQSPQWKTLSQPPWPLPQSEKKRMHRPTSPRSKRVVR